MTRKEPVSEPVADASRCPRCRSSDPVVVGRRDGATYYACRSAVCREQFHVARPQATAPSTAAATMPTTPATIEPTAARPGTPACPFCRTAGDMHQQRFTGVWSCGRKHHPHVSVRGDGTIISCGPDPRPGRPSQRKGMPRRQYDQPPPGTDGPSGGDTPSEIQPDDAGGGWAPVGDISIPPSGQDVLAPGDSH